MRQILQKDTHGVMICLSLSLLFHGIALSFFSSAQKEIQTHRAMPIRLVSLDEGREPIQKEDAPPHEKNREQKEKAVFDQEAREQAQKKEQEQLRLNYLDVIHAMIDSAKIYPTRALRRSLEGDILVRVTLKGDGLIEDLRFVSGDDIFKSSSLRAVEDAAPFPPLPSSFGGRLVLDVPLRYRLR